MYKNPIFHRRFSGPRRRCYQIQRLVFGGVRGPLDRRLPRAGGIPQSTARRKSVVFSPPDRMPTDFHTRRDHLRRKSRGGPRRRRTQITRSDARTSATERNNYFKIIFGFVNNIAGSQLFRRDSDYLGIRYLCKCISFFDK